MCERGERETERERDREIDRETDRKRQGWGEKGGKGQRERESRERERADEASHCRRPEWRRIANGCRVVVCLPV